MLFNRVESEGLGHYSYIVGDKGRAVVIDPRRDCDVYIDIALGMDYEITHVLETHRNEDYITGSLELSNKTSAEILHADAQLDYKFGSTVRDSDIIQVGRLKIQAIYTPGHTPGHMSYLLYSPEGVPWIVFTGDALFAGEVGRTDFLGREMLEKMTGDLYDSIFNRLIPLGDDIIVCPSHGAGSACGEAIAERLWTTIGIERKYNTKLQFTNKNDFIKRAKMLESPPYFKLMEELNVEGPSLLGDLMSPKPLAPSDFQEASEDIQVLDTRREVEFGGSNIPGSVFINSSIVPVYTGWFLDYNSPLLLVPGSEPIEKTVMKLARIGYDDIAGYLAGGLLQWHMDGYDSTSVKMVSAKMFDSLSPNEDSVLLNITGKDIETKFPSINIDFTALERNLDKLPDDKKIYILCGSGQRSMVAASILRRYGFDDTTVILGGMKGLNSLK